MFRMLNFGNEWKLEIRKFKQWKSWRWKSECWSYRINRIGRVRATQSTVPEISAPASPGSLFKRMSLRVHPRPLESESAFYQGGWVICVHNKVSEALVCTTPILWSECIPTKHFTCLQKTEALLSNALCYSYQDILVFLRTKEMHPYTKSLHCLAHTICLWQPHQQMSVMSTSKIILPNFLGFTQ